MSKISATQLGKPYGLSYQKVHKILAQHDLWDLGFNLPTEYAFTNGFVEEKTCRSPINKKYVEYYAWCEEKTAGFFKAASEFELARFNLKKGNATERICERFWDFGDMLEIESGSPNPNVSEAANMAVLQSYGGQMSCTRNLVLLHRFFTPLEADTVRAETLAIATELHDAAIDQHQRLYKDRAKSNLETIEFILDWICKKATR